MTRRYPDLARPRDPWTWLDTFYTGLLTTLLLAFIVFATVAVFLVRWP